MITYIIEGVLVWAVLVSIILRFTYCAGRCSGDESENLEFLEMTDQGEIAELERIAQK